MLKGLFYSLLTLACSFQSEVAAEEDQGRLLLTRIHPTPQYLLVLREPPRPQAPCTNAPRAPCSPKQRGRRQRGPEQRAQKCS